MWVTHPVPPPPFPTHTPLKKWKKKDKKRQACSQRNHSTVEFTTLWRRHRITTSAFHFSFWDTYIQDETKSKCYLFIYCYFVYVLHWQLVLYIQIFINTIFIQSGTVLKRVPKIMLCVDWRQRQTFRETNHSVDETILWWKKLFSLIMNDHGYLKPACRNCVAMLQ